MSSSSRLKSCLNPEEDNYTFYWHFIDEFWPRVGSKITPSGISLGDHIVCDHPEQFQRPRKQAVLSLEDCQAKVT